MHNQSPLLPNEMDREHPAVQAWNRLQSSAVIAERIESLKPEGRHSAVYRLHGLGPEAINVIAKRAEMRNISVERMVYEQVLSNVPVATPELYGFIEDDDRGYGWLFFEDVGDEPYSDEVSGHRELAAEWLGLMHTAAANIPAASCLPKRGVAYYLGKVQSARETLVRSLENPALGSENAEIVRSMLLQCDLVVPQWSAIAETCRKVPDTVVHGDFSFKNVRIRRVGDQIALVAFDWESAGWATPAADLPWIDSITYWSTVRREWPHLVVDDIEALGNVGKIFRCMAAIPGEGPSLASEWVDRSMRKIRFYQEEVASAIQASGWAH